MQRTAYGILLPLPISLEHCGLIPPWLWQATWYLSIPDLRPQAVGCVIRSSCSFTQDSAAQGWDAGWTLCDQILLFFHPGLSSTRLRRRLKAVWSDPLVLSPRTQQPERPWLQANSCVTRYSVHLICKTFLPTRCPGNLLHTFFRQGMCVHQTGVPCIAQVILVGKKLATWQLLTAKIVIGNCLSFIL